MNRFEKKFGREFITGLPNAPAVYLFKDEADQVLYVGKAKNIRARLRVYRNPSRRKVHRKARAIVRASSAIELRYQESEQEALLAENELIQSLQPPFNVAGKYSFLYPFVGIQHTRLGSTFCFTTDTDAWPTFEFRWFGCFPSRPRAKEAFDALIELLGLLGHIERRSALGPIPSIRGSRLVRIRQLELSLVSEVEQLLAGTSKRALREISLALLSKPRARREAAHVEALIHEVQAFYDQDLEPLRLALQQSRPDATFVSQHERDALFIRLCAKKASP